MERRRGVEELVRAREIAPVVPPDPGRDLAGPGAGAEPTPTSTSERSRQHQSSADRGRARARLRRHRHRAARRRAAVEGAARAVPRRRRPRRHDLDGNQRRAARRSARAVAGGALRHHAGIELRPGPRSAGDPRAPRPRRDLGLRQGRGLSRGHQAAAEGDRALADRAGRRRREGVRRHRRRDGKAARGRRRHRLAGQAHQSRVARVRLVAVSRRDFHHARTAAGRKPSRITAAPAAPASTSARPRRFPRRTGSMRGAASPISPSSTRGRSRATFAR